MLSLVMCVYVLLDHKRDITEHTHAHTDSPCRLDQTTGHQLSGSTPASFILSSLHSPLNPHSEPHRRYQGFRLFVDLLPAAITHFSTVLTQWSESTYY